MENNHENPFLQKKRQRLDKFLKILQNSENIPYLKAIALAEYNFGVSEKIAIHDIHTLSRLGAIEIQGTPYSKALIKAKKPSLSLSVSEEDSKEDDG